MVPLRAAVVHSVGTSHSHTATQSWGAWQLHVWRGWMLLFLRCSDVALDGMYIMHNAVAPNGPQTLLACLGEAGMERTVSDVSIGFCVRNYADSPLSVRT